MFISSSRPLAGTRVRLEDGREFELDGSGQLSARLAAGLHRVEVRVEGRWISADIEINADDDTLVVDVDERTKKQPGLVGRTLGSRYHIKTALGQGGMGTVYRAEDTRLKRPVAIKTLNEQLRSDEEASRLFLQEARQMAVLSHPHLVGVHDVTTLDGHNLMVTELVEGTSLESWLETHGPLQVDDALVVAYQMAVAVQYLHDEGVIHRDIKPANAVLEEGGGVKLIDFGLSRSLQKLMDKGTQVRGTPAYMAPEQVRDTPGPATDIYQLGATFYELLTGRLPAEPEGAGVIAYITEPNEPITSHRQDLPAELVDIIHDCLEEDPDDRPDAQTLSDRLAELHYQRCGRRPPADINPGSWTPPAGVQQLQETDEIAETLPAPEGDIAAVDAAEAASGGTGSGGAGGGDGPDHHPGGPVDSPGGDLPGRDPDYTGASGSGDVEWNRPVGRIALIIAIIAILFTAAVVLHQLFVVGPDEDPDPEPEQRDESSAQVVEPEQPQQTDEGADERAIDGARHTAEQLVESTQRLAAGMDGEPDEEPPPPPAEPRHEPAHQPEEPAEPEEPAGPEEPEEPADPDLPEQQDEPEQQPAGQQQVDKTEPVDDDEPEQLQEDQQEEKLQEDEPEDDEPQEDEPHEEEELQEDEPQQQDRRPPRGF